MRCKCGKRAVIFRPYEGRYLCRKHFLRSFEKKVKENIRKYKLIERNDRIAIGLSGGKDSSSLLHFLKMNFGKRKDLEIFAIAIDEGIRGYRDKTLKDAKKICKELDVELHIYSYKDFDDITLDEIMEKGLNEGLSSCHFCGVFRRDLLNRAAKELNATKLAIGHNLDDEVQAILMNYLKGDLNRLARMGFRTDHLVKDTEFIPRIKPFRNIPEREIGLYALLNNLPVDFNECPYAKDSLRFKVRDFLNEMEDERPTTKFAILNMYDKLQPLILELVRKEGNKNIKKCRICSEPSSGEICRKCELIQKLKKKEYSITLQQFKSL